MTLLQLYLLLAKSVLFSFSGMASLPMLQADLVEKHHVLTQQQLATAVAAGQTGPGPKGMYVVAVGYLAAGTTGAVLGWLAVLTPAFFVLPATFLLGRHLHNPYLQGALDGAMLAGAGLLVRSSLTLGFAAIQTVPLLVLAALACLVFLTRRVPLGLLVAGGALMGMLLFWA